MKNPTADRKNIVVFNHPEADTELAHLDALTIRGGQHMFAIAAARDWRFYFSRVFYSGVRRTWQAAMITLAAGHSDRLLPERRNEFHFEETAREVFGPDYQDALLRDSQLIKKRGGTVAAALQISRYAQVARGKVVEALLTLAADMVTGREPSNLVFSHASWFETAAVDPGTMPYGLGGADAIVFEVEKGVIISSELVRAPPLGKIR